LVAVEAVRNDLIRAIARTETVGAFEHVLAAARDLVICNMRRRFDAFECAFLAATVRAHDTLHA
jgi:hypothetical protein